MTVVIRLVIGCRKRIWLPLVRMIRKPALKSTRSISAGRMIGMMLTLGLLPECGARLGGSPGGQGEPL